jgi:glyoxylase-like metal-dependent hydrolase (beta-lactamase superfamily II)
MALISSVALSEVVPLGDGAYLFQSGEHRSLFLVDDAGVIVTDPLNSAAAKDYLAAVRRITDAPVRYVVYSHYHWNRVAGGRVFGDEGATFVAQDRCAQRFRDNPNPQVVMPGVTFDERLDVTVGNTTLELHYFGPSHGDCLTVFVARPAGLLQVVDLVNPPAASFPSDPHVPYIRPHNLLAFFTAVARLVETRGIDRVVASTTGGVVTSAPDAPASIVADQLSFWQAVYSAVDVAIEGGHVGIDSFVDMRTVDLDSFRSYAGYSENDLRFIMRRVTGWHDMGR